MGVIFEEREQEDAFKKAEIEKELSEKRRQQKMIKIEQMDKRGKEAIKKLVQDRENYEKNAIESFNKIEENLVKLNEDKKKAFLKNKIINEKKRLVLPKKIDSDFLPELIKIHKIIIKENFEFLNSVAEKRKSFYKLKELLYKDKKEFLEKEAKEVILDYSKTEEIDFDITQTDIEKNNALNSSQ